MPNKTLIFPVLIFTALTIGGCRAQPPSKAQKSPGKETIESAKIQKNQKTMESAKINLEVSLSRQDNGLQLEYKLKNTRSRPIYLFNVLWEFDKTGNYIEAPSPVYVSLRQDGNLHLAHQIPPLPKSRRVYQKIVPFTTKVEAGEDFSHKIKLSLPIQEYNPYFVAGQDSKYEARQSDSIIFTLQFIEKTDEMEIKPAPLPNAFWVWHQRLAEMVETSQVRKPYSVEVQKRTDKFEEF